MPAIVQCFPASLFFKWNLTRSVVYIMMSVHAIIYRWSECFLSVRQAILRFSTFPGTKEYAYEQKKSTIKVHIFNKHWFRRGTTKLGSLPTVPQLIEGQAETLGQASPSPKPCFSLLPHTTAPWGTSQTPKGDKTEARPPSALMRLLNKYLLHPSQVTSTTWKTEESRASKRDKVGHAVMGTHLVDFQQKVAGKILPEGWVHKWGWTRRGSSL